MALPLRQHAQVVHLLAPCKTSNRPALSRLPLPVVHRQVAQRISTPRVTVTEHADSRVRRCLAVRCHASSKPIAAAAASAPPTQFKWGADMRNLGISVGLAVAVWFVPRPAGVTLPAWHLLAIFLGTIVGIITKPLPLGAVAMMGLGATMLTKTLTFAAAFSAFSSEIP